MIIRFKYLDNTQPTRFYAQWLKEACQDMMTDIDMILPVPMYWTRYLKRTYNQAYLLAHSLAKQTGIPLAAGILIRRKSTRYQAKLTRKQRQQNVKHAFAIKPKKRNQIEGKHILLVDDVLSTGATLESCCHKLLAAGAASVDVVTLARRIKK
ncbi:MAG: ComF family protein [Alphaproteobacteria bacterium]|nr:ComF family protein [Alphaproteobacteria bacterium]